MLAWSWWALWDLVLELASWQGWDLVSRHSVTRPGVLDHGCLWEPGCPTCVDVEHLRASWRTCPLISWTSSTTCPPPSWTRWKRCPPLSSSSPCPWSSAFCWLNPGHLWTVGLVAHGPNELPARKKVRILEFSLLCSPHLIHSQTIWAPDGEEVLVSGFVNIQLCSPARVHQLHILAKFVLDVAYCRGQLSTKDDRSGKGRVNAGRKNAQNSTEWGFSLTCGGATGLADCSWWGRAPLLSWNNQATPEVVRFKECKIFIFWNEWPLIILTERENSYFAEEVFLQENTHWESSLNSW